MVSVLNMLTDSMQDAGIIAVGETPTAAEAQKGLRLLNRMLDTWSTESLVIYNQVQEVFSLTAGLQTYTIGAGGDFDTARPITIYDAYMRDTNGNDIEIAIWDAQQYAQIISKPITGTIALGIYYNSGYPLSEITLWPVVQDSSYRLVLWSWKLLSNFTSLTDNISFPPGFENAIEANLAAVFCAAFNRPIPPELAVWANESKAQIKRVNVTVPQLAFPASLTPGTGANTYPISPSILTGY